MYVHDETTHQVGRALDQGDLGPVRRRSTCAGHTAAAPADDEVVVVPARPPGSRCWPNKGRSPARNKQYGMIHSGGGGCLSLTTEMIAFRLCQLLPKDIKKILGVPILTVAPPPPAPPAPAPAGCGQAGRIFGQYQYPCTAVLGFTFYGSVASNTHTSTTCWQLLPPLLLLIGSFFVAHNFGCRALEGLLWIHAEGAVSAHTSRSRQLACFDVSRFLEHNYCHTGAVLPMCRPTSV